MMSKPAYSSVKILSDKPTSGKISIPQVVSVAEQIGMTLIPGANPVFMSAEWYFAFINVSHVSDRVRNPYANIIISSSLKPYQNFGPDMSQDCLLMFSVVLPPVVIHDQSDRHLQNRPRVFYQVAHVVSVAMTRENIHYIWKIVKLKIHDP